MGTFQAQRQAHSKATAKSGSHPPSHPMGNAETDLLSADAAPCACGGGCPRCAGAATVSSALGAPSEPLDAATRAYMEPRLGRSLDAVRIHHDAIAADSARSQGARAYAVGPDLVFGEGQYAPHTHTGRKLLAHELTHAVQQNFSANCTGAEPPANTDSSVEAEARRAADSFVIGGSFRPALRATPSVACDKPPGANPVVKQAEREETLYKEAHYEKEEGKPSAIEQFTGDEGYTLVRTPTEVRVEIRLHFVMADDIFKTFPLGKDREANWLGEIDAIWNNRFKFTNGKTILPLVFVPIVVDKKAHHTVKVHTGKMPKGKDRSDEGNWFLEAIDKEDFLPVAHEFGHMFGNPDEYNLPGSINEISRKHGLKESEKRRSSYEGVTGQKRPRRAGGYNVPKSIMAAGSIPFRRHVSKILAFFNARCRLGEGRHHEPRFHTEYIR